ncbi:exocyst complex component [Reticulomyxa filosa]|uniref:Exocyst complex component n=1 Tax=Reticulomyxa filosa TaxID=46433 RepID=X6NK61_RETFI|nr:exocyst complex component [Reticulomyxa filosa]|eukprot:ETO26356.1 exocyst complex component [Reticulomyxa filosa]
MYMLSYAYVHYVPICFYNADGLNEDEQALGDQKEISFNRPGHVLEMPSKFPITVPFSNAVPKFCIELSGFIERYGEFAKYLTEMTSFIRNAVQRVLFVGVVVIKEISAEMQAMSSQQQRSEMRPNSGELSPTADASGSRKDKDKTGKNSGQTRSSLGISELAQLAVNAHYLEKACNYFEERIVIAGEGISIRNNKTSVLSPSTRHRLFYEEPAPKMHEARQSLIHVASACGHALLVSLTAEIEAHLEKNMKNISYHPERSTSINEKPQSYVNELIGFVKGIIVAKLTYLPYSYQKSAYFLACTRINQYLLSSLISEEYSNINKKINIIGVYNLHLDVKAFEDFSRETGVTDLDSAFKQLRVLLDLLLSGNGLLEYLDEEIRQKKYSYVLASDLKKILERFQTKLSLFSGKLPDYVSNLDKKVIKAVLKALEHV